MAVRTANARWDGALQDGSGTMALGSGAFEGQFSYASRFESGPGTNPEELIGAAHAGCFSMAFSLILGNAGLTADYIRTQAAVSLEKVGDGFEITKVHLTTSAKIPGATDAKFQELANMAKSGCPVSKLFKAAITMDARLDA